MRLVDKEDITDVKDEIKRLEFKSASIKSIIDDLTKKRHVIEKGINHLLKVRHDLLTSTEASHDHGTGSGRTD